ncbi:prepilin-type N-terminal cleavage/methylation domain-containing protein [Caenispirillum bisanense]
MRTMQTPSAKLGTLESQKGFTLIELSIVLVIIGLLVGGVIKGQELIKGSRQNNMMNAIQGYTAAVSNYQGTYRALPGDDSGAQTRWTGTGANGNGNGLISAAERQTFWAHMRAAGLITGALADTTNPTNAFGGLFFISEGGGGFAATAPTLCTSRVPGDVVLRILTQYDNGQSNSGDIRVSVNPAGLTATTAANAGAAVATNTITADNSYAVCSRL